MGLGVEGLDLANKWMSNTIISVHLCEVNTT